MVFGVHIYIYGFPALDDLDSRGPCEEAEEFFGGYC
jgi:hypothetical protein